MYTSILSTGLAWVEDRAATMGAALAFYSAFSLAPLLIIVIALAGAVFGADAARGAVFAQMAGLVGAPAAEAIQALLKAAQGSATSLFATVVGLVMMLVGATTVLVELQDDLDQIWKAPRRAGSGLLSILRARILSLGMFLAIGFLLLVSLLFSGAMAAFGSYWEPYLPGAALILFHLSNTVLSLAAITVLFAMLFKWLPNVTIAWKDVWVGALTTAVLFSAGRLAIGLYLGRPLSRSNRDRISLRRCRDFGRSPLMALLLRPGFLARCRVHAYPCGIPKAKIRGLRTGRRLRSRPTLPQWGGAS